MAFDALEIVQSEVKQVILPSKGLLYNGKLPEGKISIRPISSSEEEILISLGFTSEAIYQMTERCISEQDKKKVAFEDLLMGDVIYLFFMLRALTYGPDYSFDHLCSKCDRLSKVEIRIPDNLGIYVLDASFAEPFFVDLPVCKQKIGLRLLRLKDERDITSYVESYQGDQKQPGHGYRQGKHVISVGDEKVIPKTLMKLVGSIRKMHARDTEAMRDTVNENEVGVDLIMTRTCTACGKQDKIVTEFDQQFFRARPAPVRRGRGTTGG